MVPLGEVMRDGMFVFYGQGYNQTYDTTLNLDLDITQKLDFITPGLSVSVKGAYDNKFKLEKYVREAPSKHRLCTTNHTLTPTVRWHRPIPTTISHLSMYPAAAILRSLTRESSSGRGQIWYLEGRINYDRTFGDHRISGLFLYNQSRNYYPDSYTYLPRNYVGLVTATYAYQSQISARRKRRLQRFGELCSGQHPFPVYSLPSLPAGSQLPRSLWKTRKS